MPERPHPADPNADSAEIVIVGAGNLGRVIYDCLEGDQRFRARAFIDDAEAGGTIDGVPIVHSTDCDVGRYRRAIVAIGHPHVRATFVARLSPQCFDWITFVDRRSHVSRCAAVGMGALVLPFASIGPGVHVGAFAYVGAYASVGSNASVGAYSTLLPRSSVGGSIVGERCIIGMNSACLNGAQIGDDVVLAPYTWVRKPVPSASFVAGNPGRIVRGGASQVQTIKNVGQREFVIG